MTQSHISPNFCRFWRGPLFWSFSCHYYLEKILMLWSETHCLSQKKIPMSSISLTLRTLFLLYLFQMWTIFSIIFIYLWCVGREDGLLVSYWYSFFLPKEHSSHEACDTRISLPSSCCHYRTIIPWRVVLISLTLSWFNFGNFNIPLLNLLSAMSLYFFDLFTYTAVLFIILQPHTSSFLSILTVLSRTTSYL